MDTTFIPLRPSGSPVDDSIALAVRRLAESLTASPEYQAFVLTAQAVSRDLEVTRLIQAIRGCRTSFGCADVGALQSELQSLPVMLAYEQAAATLSKMCVEVDQTITSAAGIEFLANVRPDKHT
jgi:cell fate (sporulation/competence/biofilm development) regulator YlbF (YheA/YmcA/DUF963 family)